MVAYGKKGLTGQVGEMMFGQNAVGVQNAFLSRCEFGKIIAGDNVIGDVTDFNGIYQRCHSKDGIVIKKCKWWASKNPQTEPQQANRGKFGQAVDDWHNLTDEAKAFYNQESKGKHKSGFNFFIAEYMRT